ncbi:hypothetical protein ALP8811_02820 [Aliiroseovarius pelagivivens]|uniref:Uncharacterized protein n=1 Tax=Aliiroseovarius pelagivivens TaxID=1639690 RepID=A0A2R8AS45_9RHOB|nr:hypothetical protein ALP8811_02820 [Aliiroseovarius pelagivivens]
MATSLPQTVNSVKFTVCALLTVAYDAVKLTFAADARSSKDGLPPFLPMV